MQKVNFTVRDCMKRIFSVLLCVVLIFAVSFRKPVKAEAAVTAATIAGGVLVATAVTALGIGISAAINRESYGQICQNIYQNLSDDVKKGAAVANVAGQTIWYTLSDAFLGSCLNGIRAAYPDEVSQWMSASDLVKKFSLGGETENILENSWSYQYRNMGGWELVNKFTVPTGNSSTKYSIPLGFFNLELQYQSGLYRENDRWVDGFVPTSKFITDTQSINWYCPNPQSGTPVFIVPVTYSVLQFIYQSKYGYLIAPEAGSVGRNSIMIVLNQATETGTMGVYNPANQDLFAQGLSVMNHKVDDVINTVGALQGITQGIRVRIDDVVGTLEQVTDAIRSRTQTQVTDVDASDDATEAENDKTNTGRDTTLPRNPSLPNLSVPQVLIHKFPFCLPFDFVNSIKTLQAPKKPPVFTVPLLEVPALKWDFKVTLDWEQFDKNGVLAGIVRWAFSILWSIALIFITKKLIWK